MSGGTVTLRLTESEAEVVMMMIWFGIQLLEDGFESCKDQGHWYTREMRRRRDEARPLYERLVKQTGTDGMNHLRR